jgi:hypothetical protein
VTFIYLSNGAIYCWWGKTQKVPVAPIDTADSILKGGKMIDAKHEWFLVYDPEEGKGKWAP